MPYCNTTVHAVDCSFYFRDHFPATKNNAVVFWGKGTFVSSGFFFFIYHRATLRAARISGGCARERTRKFPRSQKQPTSGTKYVLMSSKRTAGARGGGGGGSGGGGRWERAPSNFFHLNFTRRSERTSKFRKKVYTIKQCMYNNNNRYYYSNDIMVSLDSCELIVFRVHRRHVEF